MDERTVILLFTAAVTLHMVEEIIWLPAWSKDAARWHEVVSRRAFAAASAVFLVLLYLLAWTAASPAQDTGLGTAGYLLSALAVIMLLNIILPHLAAAIDQRRYAPGLASGLLFNLPAALLLLTQFLKRGPISWPSFILALGLVALLAIWGWPLLFRQMAKMLHNIN